MPLVFGGLDPATLTPGGVGPPPEGESLTPSDTVVNALAFGAAAAAGEATSYARGDHTHGTPVNPLTAHLAAGDPHPQYAAAAHLHVAGDIAGTAVLTADARLSDARTPLAHVHSAADVTGTAVLTNDARLSDARTPLAHTHAQSEVTSLVSALAAKEPANANLQAHVASAHAPATAQKNSDITKAEIEAVLTGTISSHAHAGGGGGDVVYTATAGDTPINVTADATIVTRDVTGVVAGDQILVSAWFTLLNNSAATRVYVITLDFDGLFDIEFSTGALAFSATLLHPFRLEAVCNVRAANLAYAVAQLQGQLPAGLASGGDTAMAATHLAAMGWGTSASNATGTLTVALKIRSAALTATQTCRLHAFTIRKVTPT